MSGSGGGGGGGGGSGGSASFSCDTLIFRTPLNSPVAAVISSLRVGDRLEVIAETPNGPAVVRTSANQIAGAITSSQLVDLLSCIDLGHRYLAVVISIAGGNVQVEIRPEPVT